LVFLLRAQTRKNNSRIYFLAFMLFLVSIAFKIITAVYLPLVIFFAYLLAKKRSTKSLFFFKRYFLLPVTVMVIMILLSKIPSLTIYAQGQFARESNSYMEILSNFWQNSRLMLIPWFIGSIGLLATKQVKKWLIINIFAFWILLFHLVTHRLATLDKHIFISMAFISVLFGQGLLSLYNLIRAKNVKKTFICISLIGLILFGKEAYKEAQKFNSYWDNLSILLQFINQKSNNGDKILVEAGAAPMLETYNKNYPLNVTSYDDLLQYRNFKNEQAFAEAVKDGYFNLIQSKTGVVYSTRAEIIQNLVQEKLSDNYQLIFDQNSYQVYQRKY